MRKLLVSIALWGAFPLAVAAQAAPAAVPPPLGWHAFAIASYTFNSNQPASGLNALRTFDSDHRRWRLQQLGISVARLGPGLGFQLDLATGSDVPVMASLGAWDPSVIDFSQAFLSWRPRRGNVELRAGKFVTTAGYEVIPTWDNPNLTYSRSFLFGYAIPFTHTGVRASWLVGPFTLLAGVNRGWDKWEDNNGALSFEGSVAFARPAFAITLDAHHGPEQAGNRVNQRRLYDLVATVKPGAGWTIGFNADYATESGASVAVPGTRAEWFGGAAYLSWAAAPSWTGSVRLERFRDADGARTGTVHTLSDAEVTIDWRATPQLLVRFDGRMDHSTAAVFQTGSRPARRQVTTAVSLFLSH